MAWTSTDLADLEDAMKTGIGSYSIAGKTMTFRSLAEMRELRAEMRRELGLTAAQNAKRVTYGRFSRK